MPDRELQGEGYGVITVFISQNISVHIKLKEYLSPSARRICGLCHLQKDVVFLAGIII